MTIEQRRTYPQLQHAFMWKIQKSIGVAENRTIRFQADSKVVICEGGGLVSLAWPAAFLLLKSGILTETVPIPQLAQVQLDTLEQDNLYRNRNKSGVILNTYYRILSYSFYIHIKTVNGQKNFMKELIWMQLTLNISRISLSVEFSKCLLIWY